MFQYFDIDTGAIQEMSISPPDPRRKEYHEIMWIRKGKACFVIDTDRYELEASSFFILPKNRIHQFLPESSLEGKVIRFTENELDQSPGLLFSRFYAVASIPVSFEEQARFELLFELFRQEFQQTSQQQTVLTQLLKVILSKIEIIKRQQMKALVRNNQQIELFDRFQQLLEEHIYEHHTVAFYADRLHVTPRKLGETVSQILNKSTISVIADQLITEAKRKLCYSNDSIYQIAYSLGFKDNSNFTKHFKLHTGQTPKAFREQHQNA